MQGAEFGYDSFTRVSRRKKRKGKARASATPSDLLTGATEELMTDGRWSLGCKEVFQQALCAARMEPQRVLCLGLGSPASSRDARAQLALLSFLCASSDIDVTKVSVYDPVFTDADGQLFGTLGMRCLDHIQGAEYAFDCPTIVYMPHCDMKLYENVIRANWTLDGLCQIIFVANRFRDYIDNHVTSKLEKECPLLLRLDSFVDSWSIPTSCAFPNAFSSLSVQYVKRTPLSLQGDSFWQPFLDE